LGLLTGGPVDDLVDSIKYNGNGSIKTADSFVKTARPKQIPERITKRKLRLLVSSVRSDFVT
jgi:hypothetical protein